LIYLFKCSQTYTQMPISSVRFSSDSSRKEFNDEA